VIRALHPSNAKRLYMDKKSTEIEVFAEEQESKGKKKIGK